MEFLGCLELLYVFPGGGPGAVALKSDAVRFSPKALITKRSWSFEKNKMKKKLRQAAKCPDNINRGLP